MNRKIYDRKRKKNYQDDDDDKEEEEEEQQHRLHQLRFTLTRYVVL